MEVLGLYFPYVKRNFQEHQWIIFFLYGTNELGLCCFRECRFWRDQRSQFKNDTFSKKTLLWKFRYVSNLCKKLFWGAPVKCFSLHGSNNSDSVVFGYADIVEIKDHSFRMKPFQKKLCYRSFRYVSTLRKKVCSGAPVKWFSLYGSNNLDFVVFGNAAFGEIKDHSLRTSPFQKTTLLSKF